MTESQEVTCYQYVNRPYAAVRDALTKDPNGIFRRATKSASQRASDVAASLQVDIAGMNLAADVSIRVSPADERSVGPFGSGPMTRLALSWEAVHAPALFPAMVAEIRIYPLSRNETQIVLRGKYEPPLGILGRAANALLMHRVAEASVHRFVNDVAELLSSELPA